MKFSRRFSVFISTTFFTGFLPGKIIGGKGAGGGLVGSIIGFMIQLWFLNSGYTFRASFFSILISFALGIIFVDESERYLLLKWGQRKRHNGEMTYKDFNETNIDEVHGQFIAGSPIFFLHFSGIQNQIIFLIFSLILFRVFDMLKPWPIKHFEKIEGAYGIMLDDTLAGLISAAIITLIVLR